MDARDFAMKLAEGPLAGLPQAGGAALPKPAIGPQPLLPKPPPPAPGSSAYAQQMASGLGLSLSKPSLPKPPVPAGPRAPAGSPAGARTTSGIQLSHLLRHDPRLPQSSVSEPTARTPPPRLPAGQSAFAGPPELRGASDEARRLAQLAETSPELLDSHTQLKNTMRGALANVADGPGTPSPTGPQFRGGGLPEAAPAMPHREQLLGSNPGGQFTGGPISPPAPPSDLPSDALAGNPPGGPPTAGPPTAGPKPVPPKAWWDQHIFGPLGLDKMPGWGKLLAGGGVGVILTMLLSKLFGKQASYTPSQVKQARDLLDRLSESSRAQLFGEALAKQGGSGPAKPAMAPRHTTISKKLSPKAGPWGKGHQYQGGKGKPVKAAQAFAASLAR